MNIDLPSDEEIKGLLEPLTPQSKSFYFEQRLFGAILIRDLLQSKIKEQNPERNLHAEIKSLQNALTKMYELAKERNNQPEDVLNRAEQIINEAKEFLLSLSDK